MGTPTPEGSVIFFGMRTQSKTKFFLLLLGLAGGVLGQGLLVLRDHCVRMEGALVDDFRVLVFLKRDTPDSRRKVAEERLLALPQTKGVIYVSPKEGLARIESDDPGFTATVALLGENPLPQAFEAELSPEALSELEHWVSAAGEIAEVADVRYKLLQADAILQVRFYAFFLTLILCFSLTAWAAVCVGLSLHARSSGRSVLRLLGGEDEVLFRSGYCSGGALIGMAAASALAYPAGSETLSAVPALGWEMLLLCVAAAAGAMFGPALSALEGVRGAGTSGMRSGSRLVAAALAAALLLPGAPLFAQTVKKKQKELSQVKTRLRSKQKEYEKSKRLEQKLSRDLKQLKLREDRAQGQLRRLEGRREKKEEEYRALGERLDALKSARESGLVALSHEVEEYRRDRSEDSEVYGRSDLWKYAYRRGAIGEKTIYLAQLGTYESRVQSSHVAAQNEGRILRARTTRTLSELLGQRQRATRVKREYASVRKRVAMTREEIAQLEENAKAIAALIKKLSRRTAKPYKSAGSAPSFAQHSLPWPSDGPVLTTFGKKRVPELNTWVINNGIEIGPPSGSAVKAVAAGEVIYAGVFRSYGQVVILDHGEGFVSIYGQLGRISRKTGERVSRASTLGEAGSGEGAQGLLYLEFRQGADALNPVTWLMKR
jgi:septal ring factor EnvC (AmiA/AmiB activator)